MSETAGSTVTDAIADVGPELLVVGGAALGVGVLVLVLKRGWGLVKKFTG